MGRSFFFAVVAILTLLTSSQIAEAQETALSDSVFDVVSACTCPEGKDDCSSDATVIDRCATSCASWASAAAGGGHLKELNALQSTRVWSELRLLPIAVIFVCLLLLYIAERRRLLGTGWTLAFWLGVPLVTALASFAMVKPSEEVRNALERSALGFKAMEEAKQAGGAVQPGRLSCSAALTPFTDPAAPWSDALLDSLQRYEGVFRARPAIPPSEAMDALTTVDRLDDIIRMYDLIASSTTGNVNPASPSGILIGAPALRDVYAARVSHIVLPPWNVSPRVSFFLRIPLAWEAQLLPHLLTKLVVIALMPILFVLLVLSVRSAAWRRSARRSDMALPRNPTN